MPSPQAGLWGGACTTSSEHSPAQLHPLRGLPVHFMTQLHKGRCPEWDPIRNTGQGLSQRTRDSSLAHPRPSWQEPLKQIWSQNSVLLPALHTPVPPRGQGRLTTAARASVPGGWRAKPDAPHEVHLPSILQLTVAMNNGKKQKHSVCRVPRAGR